MMSIPETESRGKNEEGREGLGAHFASISKDWVYVAVLLLTGSLCFGLGLIAAQETQKPEDTLWIEQLPKEAMSGSGGASSTSSVSLPSGTTQAASVGSALSDKGAYVASKSGTKYYLPSCSGAKRIKEENKVWFASKQEAESAGYEAATTCKGL